MHPPIFRRVRATVAAGLSALLLGAALVSCSGTNSSGSGAVDPNASESNPAGDIPDNQAFVRFAPHGAGWSVKVPEGWARTNHGSMVTFTDKLNSVTIGASQQLTTTPEDLQRQVDQDFGGSPGYVFESVTTETRTAGEAIVATYRLDAAADPVTGKVVNDDVFRFVFLDNGREVALTLSGPHGADNVDPWRIVTDSFQWQ